MLSKRFLALIILALLVETGQTQSLRSAEDYFRRGVKYADKGEADKAIDDFDKAIELLTDLGGGPYNPIRAVEPRTAVVLSNRAVMRMQKKEYDAAISDLSRGLRLNSGLPELWINRGVARRESGDLAQAYSDLNRAVTMAPGQPERG